MHPWHLVLHLALPGALIAVCSGEIASCIPMCQVAKALMNMLTYIAIAEMISGLMLFFGVLPLHPISARLPAAAPMLIMATRCLSPPGHDPLPGLSCMQLVHTMPGHDPCLGSTGKIAIALGTAAIGGCPETSWGHHGLIHCSSSMAPSLTPRWHAGMGGMLHCSDSLQ